MTSKTKTEIKAFFETGDKPSEAQFIDFIDSYVDKSGPIGEIETAASGGSTGFAFCSGGGGELYGAANARDFLGMTIYTTAQVSAVAVEATRNTFTTTAQASAAASDAIVSAYATTAQANTGTASTGIMNPVLTKNAIQALSPFSGKLLHITHEETGTTDGGTATSGSFAKRTLNTTKTNEISGASLASSVITLPAGTYDCMFSGAFSITNASQNRLYDTTNGATLAAGERIVTAGGAQSFYSQGGGRFTLAGTANIELQYRVETTNAGDGLGESNGADLGEANVYGWVRIWKVA